MHRDHIILILFAVIILYNMVLFGFITFLVPLVYRLKKKEFEWQVHELEVDAERQLIRSQFEVQENTLRSLALELHDNIGQKIYLAQLYLSVLMSERDSLERHGFALESALLEASEGLHQVLKSLSLDVVMKGGLRQAIFGLINQLRESSVYRIQFHEQGKYNSLPENKEISLFRIFQETINNVIRHAQARCIDIRLISTPEQVLLSVTDDGQGFDYAFTQVGDLSARAGKGLGNMVARAHLINADISIKSQPGKGTLVEISVALDQSQLSLWQTNK